MVEIAELFGYSLKLRRRYFDALKSLPWDEVVKNREASFHSLRNIFLHIIDVENSYVHNLLSGKKREDWMRLEPEAFADIDSIGRWMDEVESKTREMLEKLTPEELSRKVELKARDGKAIPATVEDVLLAAFTEYLFHIGEIIALLWQMNIEPPPVSWHYYKTQPTKP